MKYVLLFKHSIWPAGCVFFWQNGMYREFKDSPFGISKTTMDSLLLNKKATEKQVTI